MAMGPRRVEAAVVGRNLLEAAVHNVDEVAEAGVRAHLSVACILRLAQVEREDAAAEALGQPAVGTAEARAEIDDSGAGDLELGRQAIGDKFHGPAGGVRDAVVGVLIEADVDVLAAPDMEVEVVGVLAVVIAASGLDDVRIADCCLPHQETSLYSFSATWMKKSGSLSR
jgi:hypothetical protein